MFSDYDDFCKWSDSQQEAEGLANNLADKSDEVYEMNKIKEVEETKW